ncbi:hypothetical protein PspCFBP13508_02305 [Pseudomonas sp. CFBP13508]|nr:hypothetical protein PspCFBP13508_02305 [Pseudomonas sp. CFBP13508]
MKVISRQTQIHVGASLLAKAPAQPPSSCLTHRFREQARSHYFQRPATLHHSNANPCGSEPAREGAGTATIELPDPPLSRASSLPQFSASSHTSPFERESLWERACSRRRRYSHHLSCLTHRFREQARSHNFQRPATLHPSNANPCGSEPAREGAGTATIVVA